MSSNSSPTGFMDLPAELRNEVYRLAVVHDNPITVTRVKDVQKVDALMIKDKVLAHLGFNRSTITGMDAVDIQRLHAAFSQAMIMESIRVDKHNKSAKLEYKIKLSTFTVAKEKQKRKVAVGTAINMSLLRVTQATSREVSPILLWENTFVFERPSILVEFCAAIGKKAKSLSNIVIKDASASIAGEQLRILAELQEPRSISLPANTSPADDYPVSRVLDAWLSWMAIRPLVWCSAKTVGSGATEYPTVSEEQQLKVLDAINFDVSASRVIGCGPMDEERIDDTTKRAAKFKAMVEDHWRADTNAFRKRKHEDEGLGASKKAKVSKQN